MALSLFVLSFVDAGYLLLDARGMVDLAPGLNVNVDPVMANWKMDEHGAFMNDLITVLKDGGNFPVRELLVITRKKRKTSGE